MQVTSPSLIKYYNVNDFPLTGTYIPYITKTYFSMLNPPVRLEKFAIGGINLMRLLITNKLLNSWPIDGAIASEPLFEDAPVVTILETYPQLIDYDPEAFDYFKEQ